MLLTQIALNALALGSAYALVAIGFVLVLNATTAVNFAHGEGVVAGGFAAVALAILLPPDIPIPGLLLLPGVLLVTALLGLAIGALAYLPIRKRPPISVFVSTIAVGIIIANGLNATFGAAPRTAPPLIGVGTIEFLGASLSRQSLAIIGITAVLMSGLAMVLQRTQLGRQFRACAQDPEMARALGIRLTRITMISFALGTAFAGGTLVDGLDVPALIEVPRDHVLTKAFYLLQDFPGRWVGGQVWVQQPDERVNDGVSSVIIGSNDYAAAWAIDVNGRPMFPIVTGSARQRELAFRFGVNLVMYALTGNYKADQVHVDEILERLGQ
jgi:hypothetical protein